MQAASIVFAILAVGLLIILHEAGHFFAARWSGMSVRRFSIGFGPVLFSQRWGETDFQISLIPLGGFVQIDGMSTHDGTDPNAPGSYQTKPFHLKFATILAGPAANYVIGFVLLLIGFGLFNYEQLPPVRVTQISAGSAAEKAGLQKGDLLIGTATRAFTTLDDFRLAIQEADPNLDLIVERDGKKERVRAVLEGEVGRRKLGVAYEGANKKEIDLGFGQAVMASLDEIAVNSLGTVLAIAALFQPKGQVSISDFSGPLGIVRSLSERAQKSLTDAFQDVARLSIALGIFNLLPIPALDGSRLLFLALGAVRRRPISPKLEQIVHLVGLALLFGFFIVVSIGDVLR